MINTNEQHPPERSLEWVQTQLEAEEYIADETIVMSVFLSLRLQKPLLIEGPAGVGKTEIAKVLARVLKTELIRLQCYEGLDVHDALYEWNYQRQLLYLKMEERRDVSNIEKEQVMYSSRFLLERPILRAIIQEKPPVLLIDEVDRADEEFESFLLEVLSDWQVSIPELGVVRASSIPVVVLTSNRMRELSEALRRRALYLWINFPDYDKELRIVIAKVPGINARLAEHITRFLQLVRQLSIDKPPGIAETIDWALALQDLHRDALDSEVIAQTMGMFLKSVDDMQRLRKNLHSLIDKMGL